MPPLKLFPLLAFALATPAVNVSGDWVTKDRALYFSVHQEGHRVRIALSEMPPEIFAALGGSISGTVTSLDLERFHVRARVERKALPVWQGHDTCDVLYHLEYEGVAHKDHLQVKHCTYREKVTCSRKNGSWDVTHACAGTWLPADASCNSNRLWQSGQR
jgi:hypothetical protein